MLATTVDALLDRVRRDALLGSRGPVYTLAADPGSGGGTLNFNEDTIDNIGPGSLLAVEDELVYVKSVNAAATSVSVIRGHLGSTAAAHAIDSIVEVDPRFPRAALLDYAQHEINDWGSELWRTSFVDISVSRTQRTYDFAPTGEVYFLLDVRLEPPDEQASLAFSWAGDAWPHADARLLRFDGSFAIQLKHLPARDTTARVAYAQPLDVSTFTSATDLVTDVGMEPSWLEIVELGVRKRALASSGVARTDWRISGMSRNADEASVFDLLRSVQQTDQLRQLVFAKAGQDLRARWPFRSG